MNEIDITPDGDDESVWKLQALERSPASMIVADDRGKIEYVNRRFTEITGYSADEARGRTPRFLIPGRKQRGRMREIWNTISAGRIWSGEFEVRRKSGKSFWEQVSISILTDSRGKTHFLSVQEDITDRKNIELVLDEYRNKLEGKVRNRTRELHDALDRERKLGEDLKKARVREEDLNDLRSRFIAMMLNEFRTPLSSIIMATDILKRYDENIRPAERIERLDRIESAVRNMTVLLEDILKLGKIESGAYRLNPEPLDISRYCSMLVDDLKKSEGKNHNIIYSYNSRVPEKVCSEIDERHLSHILINLLRNALQFSPPGGNVYLEVNHEEKTVSFRVRDEGIGIRESELGRIFEPFYRGEEGPDVRGLGLGLTLVKRSVEMQNGEISVTSKPGVGTEFIVVLPDAGLMG